MRYAIFSALLLLQFSPVQAAVTELICQVTAEPTAMRAEGLAEPVGVIVLNCTGTPGDTVDTTLSVLLDVNVTNRLTGTNTLDAVVAAETSTGFQVVGGSPFLVGNRSVQFGRITYAMPANGKSAIRISNIRVASPSADAETSLSAWLTFTGVSKVEVDKNRLVVGLLRRGLLANLSGATILCKPVDVPEELTFSELLNSGLSAGTIRVTEGQVSAFEKRRANGTNGVRFLVRYERFPAGSRVFVPDVIAGSNATAQTSIDRFKVPAAAGAHTPTLAGSLLLARVDGGGSTGGSGSPVFAPGPPGSGTATFSTVSEVSLIGGQGVAVYEVMDSNPFAWESAHLPVWVAIPKGDGTPIIATAKVSFAPASTLDTASTSAPVPRFREVMPKPDCSITKDCSLTTLEPILSLNKDAVSFTGVAGRAGFYFQTVQVKNTGGGLMLWAASVEYRSGAAWLEVQSFDGIQDGVVQMFAHPERVLPGKYEAVLTVNAGPAAGSKTVLVTLNATVPAVEPPKPVEPQRPVISNVVSAADTRVTILSPGSLAALLGERLDGKEVTVAVDGQQAVLLRAAAGRLDFLMPPPPLARARAEVVVRVDGVASWPWGVSLAEVSPAIFAGGVFNQDGFANRPDNPELPGRIVQVFATGLPAAGAGKVTAKIHDREIIEPAYAGPAPGLTGVQQVNFIVPDDLPTMTTELVVCGSVAAGSRTCSLPAPVSLRR